MKLSIHDDTRGTSRVSGASQLASPRASSNSEKLIEKLRSPRHPSRGPQEATLQEMRDLSASIRKDCRDVMKELHGRLRDDIRKDIRQIQVDASGGMQCPRDGQALRYSATPLDPSWGKVGDVCLRPSSAGGINRPASAGGLMKRPLIQAVAPAADSQLDANADKISAEAVRQARAQVPGLQVPAIAPEEEPPMMPGLVQESETSALKANRLPIPLDDEVEERTTSKTSAQKSALQSRNTSASALPERKLGVEREKAKLNAKTKKRKPFREMTVMEIITCSAFDNLVGAIIITNAAVIGAQTDYNARKVQTIETPLVFFVFEQIFCVWFTTELSLRIYAFRCGFFKPFAPGWAWNYFDTVVVVAQLTEVFFELVARSMDMDMSKFRLLRVLRILRLVRILRVIRVLHLISELRAIVSSIVGSFRSLIWVVVLLLLMIYIVAVFFTQSVTDHLVLAKETDKEWMKKLDEDATVQTNNLMVYFGSLGRSVLSLWQAISGGLDWDTLAGPLLDQVSVFTGLIFTCFIAFALLALMNVVTGVFVQTAMKNARDSEDAFMTGQISHLFKLSDKDSAKQITMPEMHESLADPSLSKEWKSIGVHQEDAEQLFDLLDPGGSGVIRFDEFLGACLRLHGPAKAFDLLTVMQESRAFSNKLFDKVKVVERQLGELEEIGRGTQDDVGRISTDVSFLIDSINVKHSEFQNMMFSMGSAFAEIKAALGPLRMLEALMTDGPISGDAGSMLA